MRSIFLYDIIEGEDFEDFDISLFKHGKSRETTFLIGEVRTTNPQHLSLIAKTLVKLMEMSRNFDSHWTKAMKERR